MVTGKLGPGHGFQEVAQSLTRLSRKVGGVLVFEAVQKKHLAHQNKKQIRLVEFQVVQVRYTPWKHSGRAKNINSRITL